MASDVGSDAELPPAEAPPVPYETVPATVLDPFFGSGTTGQVSRQLNPKAKGGQSIWSHRITMS
jgi:hypothetical protein